MDREKFFKSCYQTLVWSFVCVGTTAGIYLASYHDLFVDDWRRTDLIYICGAFVVIGIVASLILSETAVFDEYDVRLKWKGRLLGWVAAVLLILVGILCSITGGSTASPFSHYLTSIGGLAIVFATTWRTRLLLMVASISAFVASGMSYFPVCNSTAAIACRDVAAQTRYLLPLQIVCVVFVGVMALRAAIKKPLQKPSEASSNQ